MTIFEDGDWRLVDGVWAEISIMHRCVQRLTRGMDVSNMDMDARHDSRDGWWYYVHNGTCNACRTKAPDELIGLRLLANWER